MVCIYDSGVGGLTALAALRRVAPDCDVLYLGDTARVPYGTRDASTVCRYAGEALSYLSAFSPTAVLVACGTVSSVFLPHAVGYPFPVTGIVEAGIRAAISAAPSGHIAVLGTEATVRSGVFDEGIRSRLPHAAVTSLACPLFVALAECGITDPADPLAALAVSRVLSPLCGTEPEVILLACTHFPWLAPHIARLFPASRLVDCGAAAVRELSSALSAERGTGRTEYHVTDGREAFLRAAQRMTGVQIGDAVHVVRIPAAER